MSSSRITNHPLMRAMYFLLSMVLLSSCALPTVTMPTITWPTATPNVVDVTVQNELEAQGLTVESQPIGAVLDCHDFEYWQQFARGYTEDITHGALMDRTDALNLCIKRDFKGGVSLSTGSNEVIIVMTGLYGVDDTTLGGKLFEYLVEGKTGFYLIKPNTKDVVIPTASAYMRLSNWTGELKPRAGNPVLVTSWAMHSDTVPLKDVTNIIKKYASGDSRLFADMDRLANNNADARVRNGWHAFVQTTENSTFIWTRKGEVGSDWALIFEADGMGLYVSLKTGWLEVMHPFSGIVTNAPLTGYNLSPAEPADAPADSVAPDMDNATFIDIVNTYHGTEKLWLRLALEPVTVFPDVPVGTTTGNWNTVLMSRGDISGSVTMPLDFKNTSDGFAGFWFIKEDGQISVERNFARITLTDALSPKDAFNTWWGK